jgi:hypothetical protein
MATLRAEVEMTSVGNASTRICIGESDLIAQTRVLDGRTNTQHGEGRFEAFQVMNVVALDGVIEDRRLVLDECQRGGAEHRKNSTERAAPGLPWLRSASPNNPRK